MHQLFNVGDIKFLVFKYSENDVQKFLQIDSESGLI